MDYNYAISSERCGAAGDPDDFPSGHLLPPSFQAQGSAADLDAAFHVMHSDYPMTSPESLTASVPYYPASASMYGGGGSSASADAQYFGQCIGAGTEYAEPHTHTQIHHQLTANSELPAATHTHYRVQTQNQISSSINEQYASSDNDIPLYAPIPLSAYTSLLSGEAGSTSMTPSSGSHSQLLPRPSDAPVTQLTSPQTLDTVKREPVDEHRAASSVSTKPEPDAGSESSAMASAPTPLQHKQELKHESSPFEYYPNLNAPQVMFPTPCELLTDALSTRGGASDAGPYPTRDLGTPSANKASNAPGSSVPLGAGAGTDSKKSRAPSVSASSQTKIRSSTSAGGSAGASRSTGRPKAPEKHTENQRKVYFRAVAESLGFQPTDPDTISSHDKKRNYLECLESYVQWCHEQIRLMGQEPIPIERMSTYSGPNCRSIRTILVHMEDDTRQRHIQMVEQEAEFFALQHELLRLQSQDEQLDFEGTGNISRLGRQPSASSSFSSSSTSALSEGDLMSVDHEGLMAPLYHSLAQ